MLKKKKLWLYCIIFIVGGCKSKDSDITLHNSESVGSFYCDTFSVELSTVLMDSLATSENDKLLCGSYQDPAIGHYKSISYFQVSLNDPDGNANILEYTDTPVYDSLVLELHHAYSYGDTTNVHTIALHRLSEDIRYVNGISYLFNGMSFRYDPIAIATKSFRFTETEYDELRIKISDQIGLELFDLAKNEDINISTSELFKQYFKGIVMVPDVNNTSIYGYTKKFELKLYYHDIINPGDAKVYSFGYHDQDLSFNQIINDRTNTALAGLKERYQEVTSTSTQNEAYLLTGIDLMAKLKFPYVNEIKSMYTAYAINKAELVIHPKEGTYTDFFYLPKDLVLYETDRSNTSESIVYYSGTTIYQEVSPSVDAESNALTYYKFDITDFIQKQLKTSAYNHTALLLASRPSKSGNRTERLILDSIHPTYNIKLKLYITIF
jgi:hypothetical protein